MLDQIIKYDITVLLETDLTGTINAPYCYSWLVNMRGLPVKGTC